MTAPECANTARGTAGAYVGPTSAEVIRTGGDPKDGRCTLANGQQVAIF